MTKCPSSTPFESRNDLMSKKIISSVVVAEDIDDWKE
jgi:hypothetical protein